MNNNSSQPPSRNIDKNSLKLLENALKFNDILSDSQKYWKNNLNNFSKKYEKDSNTSKNKINKTDNENKTYNTLNESNIFNSTYSNTQQSELNQEDSAKENKNNSFLKNEKMNLLEKFEISDFISKIEKKLGLKISDSNIFLDENSIENNSKLDKEKVNDSNKNITQELENNKKHKNFSSNQSFLTKQRQKKYINIRRQKRHNIKLEWKRLDDIRLIELVEKYNFDWQKIASIMDKPENILKSRYEKRLHPRLKFTKFTSEEDNLIINLYKIYGSTWNFISKFLPNRSSIMIKNRFYSNLKKKIFDDTRHHNEYKTNNGKNKSDIFNLTSIYGSCSHPKENLSENFFKNLHNDKKNEDIFSSQNINNDFNNFTNFNTGNNFIKKNQNESKSKKFDLNENLYNRQDINQNKSLLNFKNHIQNNDEKMEMKEIKKNLEKFSFQNLDYEESKQETINKQTFSELNFDQINKLKKVNIHSSVKCSSSNIFLEPSKIDNTKFKLNDYDFTIENNKKNSQDKISKFSLLKKHKLVKKKTNKIFNIINENPNENLLETPKNSIKNRPEKIFTIYTTTNTKEPLKPLEIKEIKDNHMYLPVTNQSMYKYYLNEKVDNYLIKNIQEKNDSNVGNSINSVQNYDSNVFLNRNEIRKDFVNDMFYNNLDNYSVHNFDCSFSENNQEKFSNESDEINIFSNLNPTKYFCDQDENDMFLYESLKINHTFNKDISPEINHLDIKKEINEYNDLSFLCSNNSTEDDIYSVINKINNQKILIEENLKNMEQILSNKYNKNFEQIKINILKKIEFLVNVIRCLKDKIKNYKK